MIRCFRFRPEITTWALALVVCWTPASKAGAGPSGTDSIPMISLAAGPEHGRGALRSLLYGRGYSDLWITPVRVEVLSVDSSAGGFTPVSTGPGGPARILRLHSPDGSTFTFRPIDPGRPPRSSLRSRIPLVNGLLPDETSSTHPAAALVSSALMEAVGVQHRHPRLVALEVDTARGAPAWAFQGRLGILEESLDAGAAGSTGPGAEARIIDSEELLVRLKAGPPDVVDSRAYLAARLADYLLGEFESNPARWAWKQFQEEHARIWRPVPPDADRSLARIGGLVHAYSGASNSQFSGRRADGGDPATRPARPQPRGMEMDRQLLADLELSEWDSIAARMVARLQDSALAGVADAMPAEMREKSSTYLFDTMRRRRDALAEFARAYYRQLSEDVDLFTTDAPESVAILRPDDRHVCVNVTALPAAGAEGGTHGFHRRFSACETSEIRLYLRGGGDHVRVSGRGRGGITLRVVGSGRGDSFEDSSSVGEVCVYDSAGGSTVHGLTPVDLDRRPYAVSAEPVGPPDPAASMRDYGHTTFLSRWQSSERYTGLFLGGQYSLERFGFRQPGFASRTDIRLGYSLTLGGYEAQVRHEARRANSGLSGSLLLRASTLDVTSFYGFGNESHDSLTTRTLQGSRSRYKVRQVRYQIQPAVRLEFAPHMALTLGTPLTLVRALEASSGDYIRSARPYGWGSFGQLGAQAGLQYGEAELPGRGRASIASGPRANVIGSYYPGMWGLESGFGSMEGAASLGVGTVVRGQPILGMLIGAKKLWGRYPFADAAALGGRASLLGFAEQRFTGDAAVYGQSELSARMVRLDVGVPGDFGVLGLLETGRVFLAGENSTRWHSAAGAGVWFSPQGSRDRLSLTLVRGETRSGLYARGTLSF